MDTLGLDLLVEDINTYLPGHSLERNDERYDLVKGGARLLSATDRLLMGRLLRAYKLGVMGVAFHRAMNYKSEVSKPMTLEDAK
jgi:hypothetical protein